MNLKGWRTYIKKGGGGLYAELQAQRHALEVVDSTRLQKDLLYVRDRG